MQNPGERILQFRLRAGLTQAELARRSGLNQANLSNIEKGKRDLTVFTLQRIAAALGLAPSVLLEDPQPPVNSAKPWSRQRIETLAEAVDSGDERALSAEDKKTAELLRILIQGGTVRAVRSAWLDLRRARSSREVKGLIERVRDARSRKRGVFKR